MHNLKKNSLTIDENEKIVKALNKINSSKIKILFVVNKNNKLLGSISSGDLRRAIIKKIDFNESVKKIMYKKPRFIFKRKKIEIKKQYLLCLPIVNKKKEIIDFQYSKILKKEKNNTVFLMAGGKGTRLLPLTKNLPKPLLKIKGVPIIERIIINFKKQGFKNFIISTNYLGYKIRNYLKDGKKLKVKISYINENKYLGTAGSLTLINLKKTIFPIIVANSDLISEIDYNNLINYHNKKKSDITICAKNKVFQMPFGEIIQKQEKVKMIVEKPLIEHLVSTGIYVVNKSIISDFTRNKKIMMNELISLQLEKNKRIFSYPIYEKWIDIGNKEDFYNYR